MTEVCFNCATPIEIRFWCPHCHCFTDTLIVDNQEAAQANNKKGG